MKTKALLMSVAAFLSFGNIAFASFDSDYCNAEFNELRREVYLKQGVDKNVLARALLYCEKACNLNEGSGCTRFGRLYYQGLGVKQDYQQAKTYYEKACSLNDKVGCARLGRLYANGQGAKQDYKQAKTYYEIACHNSDEGTGCLALGYLHDRVFGLRGIAIDYHRIACDEGLQDGCKEYRKLKAQGY